VLVNTLDLEFKNIRQSGAVVLSTYLKMFSNLTDLNIAENGIGAKGANAILESLVDLKIKTLNLR